MMERQFTSTAFIIQDERVLLINHRKLGKWLPPGGHMEPNETPPDTAVREALEETGLEIELISQENIWIERFNASSFHRPYLCLLEEIPKYKGIPKHQHMDFVYLAKPIGGTLKENLLETDGIKWFTKGEVDLLESDVAIYLETKQIIHKILNEALVTANG
jgi:8-oxo-dGTP pyrophosphatase MutT (NUDIX family)